MPIRFRSKLSAAERGKTPLWLAVTLPVVAILVFFMLLEGGLALFGVKPTFDKEDPFVGFASNVPLFEPAPGPRGAQRMATAVNKLNNFNQQSFPRVKTPETYRIFTVGGSTTYGRPYNDVTSFSGWLRELLPAVDRSKRWEVINAGGISYASYRVAHLMEELINYQPDLFIIYTGHNEFLEERTYGQIKEIPPLVRSTVSLLSKTRTWTAMTQVLQQVGINQEPEQQEKDTMAVEVDTILDRSAGLGLYTRDDQLQANVLNHFRVSLERMVALAKSVDAEVILVSPASSLNDCAPFKSEHTPGLDRESRQRSKQMLDQAEAAIERQDWQSALDILEQAAVADPRHADLQYRYGQALLAKGSRQAAAEAFRRAREEDVCPLRALTQIQQIVAEVADEQDVQLLDYVAVLEEHMRETAGHAIPGKELFLDHVHPTIKGHKILAVELTRTMVDRGIVTPAADWESAAVAKASRVIDGRIDRETNGQALANLARVLLWAGKHDEAARAARQAQEIAGDYLQVAVDSASILSSYYIFKNQPDKALETLYASIAVAPGAIELRIKLAQTLLGKEFFAPEEAAGNLLLACQQAPHFSPLHEQYGMIMAQRGRPLVAYDSLAEALRLNPGNRNARAYLSRIRPALGEHPPEPQPIKIMLDIYPSKAPRKVIQVRRDANGRFFPHGIEVEFHQNGRIKRFVDLNHGKPDGLVVAWDEQGNLLSKVAYRNGAPAQTQQQK